MRSTLVVCAHSAVKKKDSYFGEMYKRISKRRTNKKAIVAVAHAMLKTIWYLLKNGEKYHDLGPDYFEKKEREGKITSLKKKLQNFGVTLTPDQLAILDA